ncbi:MAG: hypothetical protein JRJ51_14565 [Deltaproteobacteria bacterium]|nr:hypothetical protein [Deltaproteobacteria bacterium]
MVKGDFDPWQCVPIHEKKNKSVLHIPVHAQGLIPWARPPFFQAQAIPYFLNRLPMDVSDRTTSPYSGKRLKPLSTGDLGVSQGNFSVNIQTLQLVMPRQLRCVHSRYESIAEQAGYFLHSKADPHRPESSAAD